MRAKKFCSRECAFLFRTNEKHHGWKGDSAGYSAIHKWLEHNFKKPSECFHCEQTKKRMEWANVSGEYMRDIKDYIPLCSSCHRQFDQTKNFDRESLINRWQDYTKKTAVKL